VLELIGVVTKIAKRGRIFLDLVGRKVI